MKYFEKSLFISFFFFILSCGTDIEDNFCPGLENCIGPGEEGSFSTFFFDSFNRADQALADSNWSTITPAGSSISIDFNQIKTGSLGVAPVAFYSTFMSHTTIRISFEFTTGANFGATVADGAVAIFARSQSLATQNNLYICGVDESSGSSHELLLYRVSGGSIDYINRGSTVPLANGDQYTLTFTLEGSELTCEISQNVGGSFSTSTSVTDSAFSTGYNGFGQGKSGAANAEVRIDNFLIEVQ